MYYYLMKNRVILEGFPIKFSDNNLLKQLILTYFLFEIVWFWKRIF